MKRQNIQIRLREGKSVKKKSNKPFYDYVDKTLQRILVYCYHDNITVRSSSIYVVLAQH